MPINMILTIIQISLIALAYILYIIKSVITLCKKLKIKHLQKLRAFQEEEEVKQKAWEEYKLKKEHKK